MLLVPDNIKYQAPSNVELLPCGFLKEIDGDTLVMSNVDGFANGQAVQIIPRDGGPTLATLAAADAVDKVLKTLKLSAVPAEQAGTNEVQTLTGGAALTGTPALVFDGYSTPTFPIDAVAATIQGLLEALPSVGAGNVAVAGGPLNTATPLTVTFQGDLAKKDVNLLVVNNGSVAGGAIAVVETTKGVPYSALPSINSTVFGPSLIELGGTTGGMQFSAKPDNVNVEYDQVEGDVDVIPVHWNVEAKGTLLEFQLKQWGYISQLGYTLRAAAPGVTGASIVDQATGRKVRFGARFTYDKQDPNDPLKDYLVLYRVASIDGIETAFDKRTPSQLPFTFHALADPDRPRGNRFYELIQETAAAQ